MVRRGDLNFHIWYDVETWTSDSPWQQESIEPQGLIFSMRILMSKFKVALRNYNLHMYRYFALLTWGLQNISNIYIYIYIYIYIWHILEPPRIYISRLAWKFLNRHIDIYSTHLLHKPRAYLRITQIYLIKVLEKLKQYLDNSMTIGLLISETHARALSCKTDWIRSRYFSYDLQNFSLYTTI